jgi:hypothetical protein
MALRHIATARNSKIFLQSSSLVNTTVLRLWCSMSVDFQLLLVVVRVNPRGG